MYDFKVVKSIKIEQNWLKMVKAMALKTTDQNILFLNDRIYTEDLMSAAPNY